MHFAGRYLFVAGLHRTGTSLLTRLMARHPDVAAIERSPAPENEGCYLQGAIPHTALHGRPAHYATDPAQHLVEGCAYDTAVTRDRMRSDWDRWFTPDETAWRIEKSPVNLTRMRLYQQLFPMAQFVVILRHPEAMAAALAKWVDRPAAQIVDYGVAAYDRMARDLPFLHAAIVVRYEDLVADPGKVLSSLCTFLQVDAGPVLQDAASCAIRDGNAAYRGAPRMTAAQAARAARWGYAPSLVCNPWTADIRHPLRAVREG